MRVPNPSSAAHPATVFVVEDDEPVLRSLEFSLGVEGFEVRTFRSSEELLAVPVFPHNACAVVDYWLPGLDGLHLVKELRKRGVDMPMVLITTNPSERTRRLSALAGVPIVEKPELGARLTEAIRKAVGGAGRPPSA
jgi:FixJ family two-component response regulator